MLPNHNGITCKSITRKISKKTSQAVGNKIHTFIWPTGPEENKRESLEYLEHDENGNTEYHILQNSSKAVLKGDL